MEIEYLNSNYIYSGCRLKAHSQELHKCSYNRHKLYRDTWQPFSHIVYHIRYFLITGVLISDIYCIPVPTIHTIEGLMRPKICQPEEAHSHPICEGFLCIS